MKKKIAQYLNEIVSITIMLLMAVALVAAQAGAGDLVRETGAGKTSTVATIEAE